MNVNRYFKSPLFPENKHENYYDEEQTYYDSGAVSANDFTGLYPEGTNMNGMEYDAYNSIYEFLPHSNDPRYSRYK